MQFEAGDKIKNVQFDYQYHFGKIIGFLETVHVRAAPKLSVVAHRLGSSAPEGFQPLCVNLCFSFFLSVWSFILFGLSNRSCN